MAYEFGISFVIPCYNSKGSIIRCLESLKTDLFDVEAVIVDDCSTDGIYELIEEYSKSISFSIKYTRNVNNVGAGESRNRGVALSSKEYLSFLDSDDKLSSVFFQEIYPVIKRKYDAIIYDAEVISSDNSSSKVLDMFYSTQIRRGNLENKKALVYVKGCTCGKIYKTEIIKNNSILFGSIPRNEDTIFTKIAMANMNSIYYLNTPMYCYYDNNNSIMHNADLLNEKNAEIAYKTIQSRLQNKSVDAELNSLYFIEVLYSITTTSIIQKTPIKDVKEKYRLLARAYKKDKYFNGYSLKYRVAFLLFNLGLFRLYKVLRGI